MFGSLCSIWALAISISYNALLLRFNLLKKLLLMAACVSSSLRYFVGVCQFWSMIWQPQQLLARGFIVSATTLGFGFLSLCLLEPTADCKSCGHICLECTQQNGVFLCKQDPIADKTTVDD